jgi:hypothetical protein
MTLEQINDRLAPNNLLVQRGNNGKLYLFKVLRGAGYNGYDKLEKVSREAITKEVAIALIEKAN